MSLTLAREQSATAKLVDSCKLRETQHMIGLLQRVREARVEIEGQVVGSIRQGLLVLVGVERGDGLSQTQRLAERLQNYRVFADKQGRMNLSVNQIGGAVLLVPQFTLAADTTQGNRPGFSRAADPAIGENLFAALVRTMQQSGLQVATGQFGADMQVYSCNDGPVTFSLRVAPQA